MYYFILEGFVGEYITAGRFKTVVATTRDRTRLVVLTSCTREARK